MPPRCGWSMSAFRQACESRKSPKPATLLPDGEAGIIEKQRNVGAIAECIVLHNRQLLDSRDAQAVNLAWGKEGKVANWEDLVCELRFWHHQSTRR